VGGAAARRILALVFNVYGLPAGNGVWPALFVKLAAVSIFMYRKDTLSEHPLLSEAPGDGNFSDRIDDDEHSASFFPKAKTAQSSFERCIARGLIIISLIFNLILAITLLMMIHPNQRNEVAKSNSNLKSLATDKSSYSGLSLDTPSVHYHHTAYWGANQTLADELWENISTDPMVVALSDDFANSHGLPRSDRFPWDETKGRYFVKVFHQLHCLARIPSSIEFGSI
jgi:hypothetical protein